MADDDIRPVIRDWINLVLDRTGWTIEQLRHQSKVSASTLNRARNMTGESTMSLTNAIAIARATGCGLPKELGLFVETPEDVLSLPNVVGLSRDEATTKYEVRSRVLDLLGLVPGDELTVDKSAKPRDRDVVIAATRDVRTGSERVLLRQLDRDFLVTRTSDPNLHNTPILMSSDAHRIDGVMVRCTRQRAAS